MPSEDLHGRHPRALDVLSRRSNGRCGWLWGAQKPRLRPARHGHVCLPRRKPETLRSRASCSRGDARLLLATVPLPRLLIHQRADASTRRPQAVPLPLLCVHATLRLREPSGRQPVSGACSDLAVLAARPSRSRRRDGRRRACSQAGARFQLQLRQFGSCVALLDCCAETRSHGKATNRLTAPRSLWRGTDDGGRSNCSGGTSRAKEAGCIGGECAGIHAPQPGRWQGARTRA